ncbi:hypothetical protein CW713_00165 [Methanophagales archaeon]|nr:MAG: hypothetical protein CW713_00165 [Methanophagales archaeon]
MVIVFDSSTLILLAKKELLDMFLNNFDGIVAIPKVVREESCNKKTFDALLIEKRIEEEKIKVYEVEKKDLVKKLIEDFNLEDGEAEAIILCIEKGSKILATDDKNAINACKVLKIKFTTAINILIRAYEKQLIEREKALIKLDNLRVVGRYKEKIIEDAKRRVIGLEKWT